MKLPNAPLHPQKRPTKSKKSSKKKILLWITVGIIVAVGVFGQMIIRAELASIQKNAKDVSSITSWKQYTAEDDNFSIKFPGEPVIEHTSIDIENHTLPYTMYEKEYGSYYLLIGTCTYPPEHFDMSDVRARLADALDGALANTEGATLISSKYIQLDGRTAIHGVYSVEQSGYTFTMRFAATLAENTLYTLVGNTTETDFKTFIRSFSITE